MKLPRFSIRTMCFLVMIAAFDCAWIPNFWKMRSSFGFGGMGQHILDLPVLVMVNVLAIACLLISAREKRRPFLLGFSAAVALLVAAYVGLLWSQNALRFYSHEYLMFFQNQYCEQFPLYDMYIPKPFYILRYIPLYLWLSLCGTLPMIMIAALIGYLYKFVVSCRGRTNLGHHADG